MTILDMLISRHTKNNLITNALEIIKDDYTNLVNDNYELTIDENGALTIKIPSLEKRDEYVYNSIAEYQYPLIMCMRISESKNDEKYQYILTKFLELYKDKLELFFKDVVTVNTLKQRIIKTKDNIDNITYTSAIIMILGAISLCIFSDTSQIVRNIIVIGIVIFSIIALIMQITKEGQVKNVVDAYINLVKTEWYVKELRKQYVFLCNFMR